MNRKCLAKQIHMKNINSELTPNKSKKGKRILDMFLMIIFYIDYVDGISMVLAIPWVT